MTAKRKLTKLALTRIANDTQGLHQRDILGLVHRVNISFKLLRKKVCSMVIDFHSALGPRLSRL